MTDEKPGALEGLLDSLIASGVKLTAVQWGMVDQMRAALRAADRPAPPNDAALSLSEADREQVYTLLAVATYGPEWPKRFPIVRRQINEILESLHPVERLASAPPSPKNDADQSRSDDALVRVFIRDVAEVEGWIGSNSTVDASGLLMEYEAWRQFREVGGARQHHPQCEQGVRHRGPCGFDGGNASATFYGWPRSAPPTMGKDALPQPLNGIIRAVQEYIAAWDDEDGPGDDSMDMYRKNERCVAALEKLREIAKQGLYYFPDATRPSQQTDTALPEEREQMADALMACASTAHWFNWLVPADLCHKIVSFLRGSDTKETTR